MSEYYNYNQPEQEPQAPRNDLPHSEQPIYPEYTSDTAIRTDKQKKRGRGRGPAVVALALCCSLLGGAAGAGGVLLSQRMSDQPLDDRTQNVSVMVEGQRQTSQIQVAQVNTSRQMTPAEVYAANVQSTVGITTSITTNYWGFQTTSAASGSGFIISDDGYILTNHHVIENSNSITVTMYDGTAYDATLVGYDKSNDIAVLKIDGKNLTPVILGDSDNLNVGDNVVAIGNPLGELTFSLTAGLVSAKDRQITLSGGTTMNLLQTDTAINSGNSGGALFNLYGEVVGVTNAKYSGSSASEASIDNIGFAIPINSVRSIVESIIEKGYVSKPYIGVSVSDVSEEARLYGLPQGAAVQSVTEDAPAAKAGLQVGDIITQANGMEITGSGALVTLVKTLNIGDALNATVYRQGQTLDVNITVEEQIQSARADEEEMSSQQTTQRPTPWVYR